MIPRSRKARWAVAAVAALLCVAGVLAAYAVKQRRPGDVSNPEVAFTVPSTTSVPPAAPAPGKATRFDWPVYGYTNARTRDFPLWAPARPPFPLRWAVRGTDLLEFGPVAAGSSLYLLKNNGALYAIRRRSGLVSWKDKLGNLAASSPAYWRGIIFCTLLEGARGSGRGRVVAVNAYHPRERWSRTLASRTETSPIVVNGTLYVGSESGRIYAFRARDGMLRWSTDPGGAVKGGLAYDSGRLYFGDYAGQVHALSAATGKRIWSVNGGGGAFGLGAGRYYATAAVAFGRVYLGNVNGSMYSFSAQDGRLAWRRRTGNYIYSSAAVSNVPGLGPTVYVGSYDGNLYALDARTGSIRWRRRAEGRISGGIQVIGDLVFYSTLNKHTTALGAATGRRIWSVRRGKFNPVISDGRYLFLNGQTSLFAYDLRPDAPRVKLTRADRRQPSVR